MLLTFSTEMNRSTSVCFVRFIFSKSTGIYRLQLFYCQCSISSRSLRSRLSLSKLSPIPFLLNSLSPTQRTFSILSSQFLLSISFLIFFIIESSISFSKKSPAKPLGDLLIQSKSNHSICYLIVSSGRNHIY